MEGEGVSVCSSLYKTRAPLFNMGGGQICSGWDGQDRMHLNRPKVHAKAFNKKKRLGFTFVGL
jgi:hypothetical protein